MKNFDIKELKEPLLSSDQDSVLETSNHDFKIGRIAALFCQLRRYATHFSYNNLAILKLASTKQDEFISQIQLEATRYDHIADKLNGTYYYKEISKLMSQLNLEYSKSSTIDPSRKACIMVGFAKQEVYYNDWFENLNKKKFNKLNDKKNKNGTLTDDEQAEFEKLKNKLLKTKQEEEVLTEEEGEFTNDQE